MTRILADAWASYRERVIPADAPAVQVEESQRAFYAGATAIYYGIMAHASPGPGEPTEADMNLMESLDRELRTFSARVGSMA